MLLTRRWDVCMHDGHPILQDKLSTCTRVDGTSHSPIIYFFINWSSDHWLIAVTLDRVPGSQSGAAIFSRNISRNIVVN